MLMGHVLFSKTFFFFSSGLGLLALKNIYIITVAVKINQPLLQIGFIAKCMIILSYNFETTAVIKSRILSWI